MMASSISRIAAVVVSYNGMPFIDDCILSLQSSELSNLSVYMVDSASADESPDYVAAKYPDVGVIRCKRNMGWAAGNNRGVRQALRDGSDAVWLVNQDVVFGPKCLPLLLGRLATGAAAIWSPIIYTDTACKQLWHAGGRLDMHHYSCEHTGSLNEFRSGDILSRYVSGCAMLVRREVFEAVGLIDERFFMYFEDADFCRRAALAGFGSDIAQEAALVHKTNPAVSPVSEQRANQIYHVLRSGLLFWRKHLGFVRFHRGYCPSQLGKWVNPVPDRWREAETREWARAVIDALWYFISGMNCPLERPPSPEWFRWLMTTRPWLVAELMSFRASVERNACQGR